jgi:hypothetical protein
MLIFIYMIKDYIFSYMSVPLLVGTVSTQISSVLIVIGVLYIIQPELFSALELVTAYLIVTVVSIILAIANVFAFAYAYRKKCRNLKRLKTELSTMYTTSTT